MKEGERQFGHPGLISSASGNELDVNCEKMKLEKREQGGSGDGEGGGGSVILNYTYFYPVWIFH